jgi:hypothetical protein
MTYDGFASKNQNIDRKWRLGHSPVKEKNRTFPKRMRFSNVTAKEAHSYFLQFPQEL